MAQSLKYLPYTHEDWSSNPMLKPTISALGTNLIGLIIELQV